MLASSALFRACGKSCAHHQSHLRLRQTQHRLVAARMSAQQQPGDTIDDADWSKLGAHLSAYDEKREAVIKRCRDSQKLAKGAIYSLHRKDLKRAEQQIKDTESVIRELLPILSQHPGLRYGSYAATVEEWVEAVAFLVFLNEGRLLRASEVPLAEPEEYLGGVLDMTGELNRWAIAKATTRDKAAVQRARDLVDALMGRFLQFDLRNGALRRKFDGLKYTLKKLENTLYELSLTDALGMKRDTTGDDEEPDTQQQQGGAGQE